MFENDYKKAIDEIKIDEQTREKILDKIILKEELKKQKNPATIWRVAFACVACVAIVLGVMFVPSNSRIKPTINQTSTHQTLMVSKSYNEIYKLIKPKYNFLDDAVKYKHNVKGDVDMGEIIVEEETVYESVTDDSAGNPSNINGGNTGSTNKADKNSSADKGKDYSNTTEQVEGVAEADIVKTDGEYIYYLMDNELTIFKADGKDSAVVSKTVIGDKQDDINDDMFLKGNHIIILQSVFAENYSDFVKIIIYDVSNPKSPVEVAQSCQEGLYKSSRMVGDYVYIISNCYISISEINKDDPTTFVPTTKINGVYEAVPADSIYHYEQEEYNSQYTVIGAFNYKDGALNDTASLLGGTDNIYCSQGNIILADASYSQKETTEGAEGTVVYQNTTTVSRLEIKEGNIEYKVSGEIAGVLNNQFFIDEYNNYFRFVTTVTRNVEKVYKFENQEEEVVSYSTETSAQLTILDSQLQKTGEIGDLAKGERVYSVRFMGDVAYFVTFRQTDPLFSADLSDPNNPKILGELKIPGFSEYMYPYGNGLLLGFGMDADENTGRSKDLKLSMFDITDPTNVVEQDKTIIDGCGYSPALSNHKSMLVNPSKNLIGFAATEDWQNEKYMIYEYTGDSFVQRAALSINDEYGRYAMTDVRGIFIGDVFYLISEHTLQIFDMNTYLQIGLVKI